MSDVRSCKGKAVRTESKDLALHYHSAFLIPHSNKAFLHNQWTEPPHGLTLNPEPINLNPFLS